MASGRSTTSSDTVSTPRFFIACTAFAQRFITTWWICVASPITVAPLAPRRRSSRTCAGRVGRGDRAPPHHRLHVDRYALAGAAPREGEDALHQRFGTLARRRGRRRGGGAAACLGRFALRHVAVAEDRGEDVVEVVRDAAGERADRFELLRLQLPLEARALGGGLLCAVMSRAMPSACGRPR